MSHIKVLLTVPDALCYAVLCCAAHSVDSVEEEVAAELKQLMDEVWVLGSLSHPSITRFCALCLDPPMIVMQVRSDASSAYLCAGSVVLRANSRVCWPTRPHKRCCMLCEGRHGGEGVHSRAYAVPGIAALSLPCALHGSVAAAWFLLPLATAKCCCECFSGCWRC
jgi:hypothetical protein